VLANMTLDGLEALLQAKFPQNTKRKGKYYAPKLHLVRYADDVRHLTHCSIPLGERRSSEEMTSGPLGLPGGESQRGN